MDVERMERKRFLIIKGESQYDAMNIFIDDLIKELEKYEIDLVLWNPFDNTKDYMKDLKKLSQKSYDVIFTMNSMGSNMSDIYGLLSEKGFFCTMLMDHPLVHHERLSSISVPSLVLSPDWNHVYYLEKYYPNITYESFLPHAGCQTDKIVPYRERTIDVSFIGSYASPEEVWKQFEKYPLPMRELMYACVEDLKKDTTQSLEAVLEMELASRNIYPDIQDFAVVASEFKLVDQYIRCYYRDQVVRSLVQAGVAVDVYGNGWNNIDLPMGSSLRIHDSVSYQESLSIMGHSKISLNVMPWFKNGSHDRVFTAMLCGAVCLSDPSLYLQNEFVHDKHLLFYSLNDLSELPSLAKNLLCDDSHAEQIAINGKEIAKKNHTWLCRGQEIISYLTDLSLI